MSLFIGVRGDGVERLNPPPTLEKTEMEPPQIEAALAPVTYVSSAPKPFQWLGELGQTIQSGFRRAVTPAAACLVASTLLLSGCAMTGASIRTVPASIGVTQQQVDVDRAFARLEARANASQLARQMEHHTKNFATPVIGIFIDEEVATQTEHGGRWDEDKNRAFTVHQLGPNNSLDMLLLCPVSGHAKDHYPDELYQRYTSHQSAPSDDRERMRANAQIYSHNNSQYVYLTDDPSSYETGRIVVADVKANGRYVTPVRVHLEDLQPGKTYEVRWSPFVGSDPNNPLVDPRGFRNGRTFRLIVPTNVAVVH